MNNFKEVAQKFKAKLEPIKVALFDVDGVLTTGHLYYDGVEVGFNRSFHAQDGYGFKILQAAGLKVGIITGGKSLGVRKRFAGLQVDYIHMGSTDKRSAYLEVKEKFQVSDQQILYMGDDFFDLPLLRRCGFSATVPHASLEIQEQVDYVTSRAGGYASAREVIDILRYAQNIVPEILDFET